MNPRPLIVWLVIASALCAHAIAQTTPRQAFMSTLVSGDVTDGSTFILIDLDDTDTFPHAGGDLVKPHKFILNVSATSDWDICLGPVIVANVTSGTAAVAIKTIVGSGKTNLVIPVDDTLRMDYEAISDTYVTLATSTVEDVWDCNRFYLATGHGSLTDAVGTTTKSASAGDWVARFIEKVSGTINVNLSTIYSTE